MRIIYQNPQTHLFHGTDEVLCGLADFSSTDGSGTGALIHGVWAAVTIHLHGVGCLSWPEELTVHDEVHGKHIQTLEKDESQVRRAQHTVTSDEFSYFLYSEAGSNAGSSYPS